jgi:hypothetical protein
VAFDIAGTLYEKTPPLVEVQRLEVPEIFPAGPTSTLRPIGNPGEDAPVHTEFEPATDMVPPVKEVEKLTVMLFVPPPVAIDAPEGKLQE